MVFKVTHKFDFKERKKLINEKRKKILPAEKTLLDLDLKKGDVFADIGSGIGYFSFPASKIIGPQGKVYAMDISEGMLNEIKKIIEGENILNIELVETTEDNLVIPDNTINFAFTSTVLHEVDYLDSLLEEIKRIMVNRGRLVIIEWNKIKSEFGPPMKHRIEPADIIEKLEKLKFQDITASVLNEYLYTITCFK